MQRVTITINAPLLAQLDEFMQEKKYDNRSEAIRDMVRDRLEKERLTQNIATGGCVATVSYIYNHEERELPKRLAGYFHQHHVHCHSAMNVYLDEQTCLETLVLKGEVSQVQMIANQIIAERGVRHGQIHLIPVELAHGVEQGCKNHAHTHDHNSQHTHEHSHEHKHVHAHDHTHEHEHWHTHKNGTYHTHAHRHTHAHPHEHIHKHNHHHAHSHDHQGGGHTHNHQGDHKDDFRAHDHDHLGTEHGPHDHDHPGHDAEVHDDHNH